MINTFYAIRSLFFYLGYGLSLFWFSTTGILFFSFLPYKFRSNYVLLWNRFLIFWLKVCCGLGVEVLGSENIPARSYVALAKHQSQWETYFLQVFLAPISIVLKRELLNIPFFGWGLRLTDPIAIDRGSPKQSFKTNIEFRERTYFQSHIRINISRGDTNPLGKKSEICTRRGEYCRSPLTHSFYQLPIMLVSFGLMVALLNIRE